MSDDHEDEAAIAKNDLAIAAAERALIAVNEAQAYVDENIGNLSTEALRDLSETLTKANDALKAIQAQLDLLAPPLADLSAGIDAIGAAIDSGLTTCRARARAWTRSRRQGADQRPGWARPATT